MGNDDHTDDDLDLDQALEALDLDTNFLESNSFDVADTHHDGQVETQTTTTQEVPAETQVTPSKPTSKSDLSGASSWMDRPEIWSRHYKPSPIERESLEQIAAWLGVKSGLKNSPNGFLSNPLDNLLGGGNDAAARGEDNKGDSYDDPQSIWNRLVVGKSTKQTQQLPVSLLLQQGTVLYKEMDEATGDKIADHHGCELILFTRGFLIAKPEISFGFFGKKNNILQPLGSALWTDVTQIQVTVHQTLKLTCGGGKQTKKDPNQKVVHFEVVPTTANQDLDHWKHALQTAATLAHQHFQNVHDSHMLEQGWQYRLCHTPWFTEAVTGVWEDVGLELSTSDSAEAGLDQLDDFNQYAPLHYATRAQHLDVIRHLLQAGANPNVQDGEGKTPMYYGTLTHGSHVMSPHVIISLNVF